ncbi:tail fiber domain-containing protein [Dyadobacter sp. OTU695]|uniref:tail fiber domain-containing protein n=1 Tax=Dyadobacter sp. OTU695 TaxID=3043860 RepID=UPI00313BA80D
MNKWYKMTGALLLGVCAMTRVNAQTHYGVGAGTQGPGHAFFGTQAGASNIANGLDNSFIGHQAGFSNLDGVYNVFVGSQAGYFSKSGGNVFVGYKAGYQNISGPFNTFIGGYAGKSNLGGGDNLFAGYSTGFLNTSGNDNTFLGNHAGDSNITGNQNVFVGRSSGNTNSNGNFNTFLGFESGITSVDGSSNTYLGYKADGGASVLNATAIGANAKVTSSNSLVLGYKANVCIGISAPSFQLHLSTDAAAKAGSPDWTVASDSRLKKNITDFTDGLDLLQEIKPVWFQYNGKAGIETGDKKFVGIIAQEMQKIAPYTVGSFTYQDSLGNKTEYLDYDANAVTYILINSVKEQQQVIEQEMRS